VSGHSGVAWSPRLINNNSLLSQAPQRTNSAILQTFLKADLVSGSFETSERHFSAYSCDSLILPVEKTCISFLFKPTSFLGKGRCFGSFFFFLGGGGSGEHDTDDTDTISSYACMLLYRIIWLFTQIFRIPLKK